MRMRTAIDWIVDKNMYVSTRWQFQMHLQLSECPVQFQYIRSRSLSAGEANIHSFLPFNNFSRIHLSGVLFSLCPLRDVIRAPRVNQLLLLLNCCGIINANSYLIHGQLRWSTLPGSAAAGLAGRKQTKNWIRHPC